MCDTFKVGDPQKPLGLTGFGIIVGIIAAMFLLSAANEKGVTDKIVDKIPKTKAAQERIEVMRDHMKAAQVRNR